MKVVVEMLPYIVVLAILSKTEYGEGFCWQWVAYILFFMIADIAARISHDFGRW